MDDHLALGGLLEDYLRESLTGSPVQQLTALGDIDKIAARGHLICIAYAGDAVDPTEQRWDAIITQRWLTIVTVQTAGKANDPSLPLLKAGPLLWRLGKLVQGKRFPGYKALKRITPPAPRFQAGFAHFPLAWETSFPFTCAHEPL